jgi:hypothetical protein
MAGMLQIITYLLCVYLVFKAVEIFQLATTGQTIVKWRFIVAILIGLLAIASSLYASNVFVKFIDMQAESLQHK